MTDIGRDFDRVVALERADARRKAIEEAIRSVDGLEGNDIYQKAWKVVRNSLKALMLKD